MCLTLSIGPLLETSKHDIGDILRESLEHERFAEVDKMLRKPGDIEAFAS